MKAQLLKHWDRIQTSYWFMPTIMAGGAVALSFATSALDQAMTGWVRNQSWAYSGGAEGASAVLGTIAGSMITIAGVVFSMTLVALSLASSQFGPRLMRNFIRDTINQVVLGTFVATFLYCLLVLRTIRRDNEGDFVPHLSVTLGVLFAIVSLGVLIYFIHHVAVSIQADEIVARVGAELVEGIDYLFPEHIGQGALQAGADPSRTLLPAAFEREARSVMASGDGYLQLIDADALMTMAVEEDVVIRVQRRPGHYVVSDSPLVWVWPEDRINGKFAARVNSAFVLGKQRSPVQDIEFAVHQLVEIAVRALSPGVNDPFSAITCVDRLGSALHRLAQREMPFPYRADKQGRLRVVAPSVTFPGIMDAAFNQIRQYARSNAAVAIRLLETITAVAEAARRPEDKSALRRHADMIVRGAREGLPEEEDRRNVETRYGEVIRALEQAGGRPHLP